MEEGGGHKSVRGIVVSTVSESLAVANSQSSAVSRVWRTTVQGAMLRNKGASSSLSSLVPVVCRVANCTASIIFTSIITINSLIALVSQACSPSSQSQLLFNLNVVC